MADQVDLLHVRRIVIEHNLSAEVEVSWLLGSKLETYDCECLALDESNMWIGCEGLSWILLDFIINWGVRSILNLNRLVNGLSRSATWEMAKLRWVQFDHRNERLRARRETVADHPYL